MAAWAGGTDSLSQMFNGISELWDSSGDVVTETEIRRAGLNPLGAGEDARRGALRARSSQTPPGFVGSAVLFRILFRIFRIGALIAFENLPRCCSRREVFKFGRFPHRKKKPNWTSR